ncbi:MAG: hypothetical protein SF182_28785 [Deltaproteobacteria bacterium]|nr:hypothetical protein [Deltaproteobacteria bacterium]
MRDRSAAPSLGVWAAAVGAAGFASGFLGPIALVPGANQGPLLGLLITGPGAVALGLAAGIVARLLPLSDAQRWRALSAVCGATAVIILIGCLLGPW